MSNRSRSEFVEEFTHWFTAEQLLELARQTEWLKRQGKIIPFEFVVGAVFGQLSALRLSLSAQGSNFTQPVSRQAIDQRYHEPAVNFFAAIFRQSLARGLADHRPASLGPELARHFQAVQVVDSTSFDCPESLATLYPGAGGDASAANCKILLRYEYLSSQFEPVALVPGKRSDQGLAGLLPTLVQANELMLMDKGFLKLSVLQAIDRKQAFFLLPLAHSLKVHLPQPDGSDKELKLAEQLRQSQQRPVQWSNVKLGCGDDAPIVRMVAFALNEESTARRRAALREAQRKQGRTPTAEALELAGWLILITNAPADKLPAKVMSYLYRVRWQIELVFKQCKSVLRLDVTQAQTNLYRIQCEIWARLIAAVVVFAWHSYLQRLCWAKRQREISFAQVASQLQQHGNTLARSLIQGGQALRDYLGTLLRNLLHTTVKGRQKTRKTTWENLEEHWLQVSAH